MPIRAAKRCWCPSAIIQSSLRITPHYLLQFIPYPLPGAIIHYSPTPETDKAITSEGLFMVDSGGQVLQLWQGQ